MTGTVKMYSLVKGSGTITGDDGVEYKVKVAALKVDGFKKLSEGQKVNFEAAGTNALEVTTA